MKRISSIRSLAAVVAVAAFVLLFTVVLVVGQKSLDLLTVSVLEKGFKAINMIGHGGNNTVH